jgi:uncharacterized protein (DUF697 family)
MSWLDTLEEIQNRDFTEATPEEQERLSREVINLSSYACAVAAVVPLPFSDALLMLPIQSTMVITIGHIHGRKLERTAAKEIITELATLAGASFLIRQGIKAILPVFGAVLTIPAAFAANWAMGRVALEYFKNPGATREQLKMVYEQAKAEGSKLFSKERFESFRKKNPSAPAAETTEKTSTREPPRTERKKPRKSP